MKIVDYAELFSYLNSESVGAMCFSVQLWHVDCDPARALIDIEAWSANDERIAANDLIEDGIIDSFILIPGSYTYHIFSLCSVVTFR